jgi:hypothetical protein
MGGEPMADASDRLMGQKAVITDQLGFRAVPPKSKSLRRLQVLMGAICGAGGVLLILYFFADRPGTVVTAPGFSYATMMFLAGGLGFVYLWLWRTNVRLLINRDQVGYRDILGRRHFWSRGQIERAVDMAVMYTKTAQARRGVYLLAADGRRVLALNTRAWDANDVHDFIEASGAVLDYRDQPVTASEARRQFPQAFGWGSQHVTLATIITMILAVVLAIGGFVLWTAATRG